jgi:hypothetical protein
VFCIRLHFVGQPTAQLFNDGFTLSSGDQSARKVIFDLAALDAKKYKGEIEAELVAALAIDPATELDRVMQARAEALLDILGTKKPGEIEKTAQGML